MDTFLAAARFLHCAAAIQLFGVAAFHVLLVPRDLKPALEGSTRSVAIVSGGLALLSGIAWLMATAATMGDGPGDATNLDVLGAVLFQTRFGGVWGPHLVACVLAFAAMFVRTEAVWWIALVLATLILGSLGLVGHAAMDTGILGLLNETSQVLHVLSSGFWLGALLPLLFLLTQVRKPETAPAADAALRRFSGLGHIAVAILLLSGVANTWFVLGGRVNLEARYDQLLIVKIGIAGTMCILAIVNRYVFMPRIPNGGPGARQLAHGTVAEIVLGTAVLLLVGAIGMMSPN